MQGKYILRSVLLSAVCLLSSCEFAPKDTDATLAVYAQKFKSNIPQGATGQEAFKNTFYPFAVKNCVSCHGAAQTPLFAVSNVTSSYNVARDSSYVSFTSIASSKLVTYSGNGHCGTAGCAANSAAAAVQVQAWADVELSNAAGGGSSDGPTPVETSPPTGGPSSSALISTALSIPTPLPSGTAYKVMRWNLSQLMPASPLVGNAIFEIEVQLLSTSTYRVRNPRIIGLSQIVRVSGIHIFVKPSTETGIGVEDLGAGSVWASDVVNAPISTLPATLPAGPITAVAPLDAFAMVIGVRSNQDSFTIAFDKLEMGVATAATFASISQTLLIPKCVDCHGATTAYGGVRYDTYAETLKTVILNNTGNRGRLYLSTLGANATMPIGGTKFTPAESAGVASWIDAGAQNN